MVEQLTVAEGLMLRAGIYRLLAQGYAYPGAAQRDDLIVMAEGLAPWLSEMGPQWAGRLERFATVLTETDDAEREAEFNQLFSGAMAAAPYETAYERDIFRKQATLADIAGFYQAFGFVVAEGNRWQPDHLGVQLEFCAIVLQRTAYAMAESWTEQSEICVDALRKFLNDHTGRWADALAGDVERSASLSFYQELASLTRDWVALEVRALELEPDALLSRHILEEDSLPPACGGCTGCGPEGPQGPDPVCPSSSPTA